MCVRPCAGNEEGVCVHVYIGRTRLPFSSNLPKRVRPELVSESMDSSGLSELPLEVEKTLTNWRREGFKLTITGPARRKGFEATMHLRRTAVGK